MYHHTLFQRQDQPLGVLGSAYTAALWKRAADCNFGTLNLTTQLYDNATMLPLDVMLQESFMCGFRDAYIQQRLFTEQDLSFRMAYDIALHAEDAVKQQQGVSGR